MTLAEIVLLREGGPDLGGEVGGLALAGIVVELVVRGSELFVWIELVLVVEERRASHHLSETKESEKGNSKFYLQQVNFSLTSIAR